MAICALNLAIRTPDNSGGEGRDFDLVVLTAVLSSPEDIVESFQAFPKRLIFGCLSEISPEFLRQDPTHKEYNESPKN